MRSTTPTPTPTPTPDSAWRQVQTIDSGRRLYRSIFDPADTDGADDELPRVRGYLVLERIGEGGGGEVYLAMRRVMQQPVALKILRRAAGIEASRGRIWRELDLLMHLHLPCMPRVHDYGMHDGRLYIATDYVDGKRLDAYCDRQRLDRNARIDLLARVAEAVQQIHEVGVLHRDLKPGNIMIDRQGNPIIIDFGLAQLIQQGSNAAAGRGRPGDDDTARRSDPLDRQPCGSPAFMAPEQATGDYASQTVRTDVYGLGATGTALLTGHSPHDTKIPLADILKHITTESARDPKSLDPTLPGPIAAILRKALAVDPAQRYESAFEFARELRRWLRHEPVDAAAPGVLTRVNLFRRRQPGTFVAIVGLLMLGASSIGLGTWGLTEASERVQEARMRQEAELLAEERAQLADERLAHAREHEAYSNRLRESRIRANDLARKAYAAMVEMHQRATANPEFMHAYMMQAVTTMLAWAPAVRDGDFADEELIEFMAERSREILDFIYQHADTLVEPPPHTYAETLAAEDAAAAGTAAEPAAEPAEPGTEGGSRDD